MLIPLLGYNIILSIQLSVRASYNTEQLIPQPLFLPWTRDQVSHNKIKGHVTLYIIFYI